MSILKGAKRAFLSLSIMMAGCAPFDEEPQAPLIEGDITRASWPTVVQETSGLALYAGLNWTVNDSGGDAVVYGINDQHAIAKQITISGAKNVDWESLAQDDEYLYIADCGNNRARRAVVQIYKVAWTSLLAVDHEGSVEALRMNIRYADFPALGPRKNHRFDCEALTVVDDALWLFTKNWNNEKTNLYRLDKSAADQTVSSEQVYEVDGLITGADFDPLSRRLVLLGYDKNLIFGQSFIWLIPVEQQLLWDRARRIKLYPYAQWEAIAWNPLGDGNELILTSEKSPLLDVSIGRLKIQPDLGL
ncbi:hypothetical protein [Neptuniibacter pectenicola]|jgi:hypothetical protein|uniref:hypothetical protein n=1 Tax=Neptuniibacter pectenicola TaxID=1806669 RepID=UPI003AE75474